MKFAVKIKGVAPLLMQRYPLFEALGQVKKTRTSAFDISEYKNCLYLTDKDEVYQPSVHFEQSMLKASSSFKIPGKGKTTWKSWINSNVLVQPDEVLHGLTAKDFEAVKDVESRPYRGGLLLEAGGRAGLFISRVVIQRSAVPKVRPIILEWELEFTLNTLSDECNKSILREILEKAGIEKGIGDWRPKFGRFKVINFKEV